VLHALIKQNVRTPDAVLSDLAAQVAIGQSASERLMAMCQRYRLIDIEGLSDKIISRSEAATRAAIGKLKRGTPRPEPVRRAGRRNRRVESRSHHRSRGRRDFGRFHRVVAADQEWHQRRAQLHARLLGVRDPLMP
jgi:N-methylhydantoinase B/oxoprolinase/acetone carboxylase alpha subunit